MENINKQERKIIRLQKIYLYLGIILLFSVFSRFVFARLLSIDDFVLLFTFHKYPGDFLNFITNYWYLKAHVIGYWWGFILGIFFMVSSFGIKKRKKITLYLLILFGLSHLFFIIFKISLRLDDIHEIYKVFVFSLILILVIWTVLILLKKQSLVSSSKKKSYFVLSSLSIIAITIIILSQFYFIFIFERATFDIAAQKSIKNFNSVKKGMTKKDIIKLYHLPHIKHLVYRYNDKVFFSIPIRNGYVNYDLIQSEEVLRKELKIIIIDRFDEKIKKKIPFGKKEDIVLEKFGSPVFTMWSYIKWKGHDTFSVFDVIFKNNQVIKIPDNIRVEGGWMF